MTKTLPLHADTLTELAPPGPPVDVIGYFVTRGPAAKDGEVLVRPDPKNSIVGAPLAYAIVVDGLELPLNNHVVIEYGLKRGLLKATYFDYGGSLWTDFADAGMSGFAFQARVAGQ